jgi:hypothetical protein
MGTARVLTWARRWTGTNSEACKKRNPNIRFKWKGGDSGSR